MGTLNVWFHWLFSSPGYFLLGLIGLLVLFGLIGGMTHSHSFAEADDAPSDEGGRRSGNPWWKRDEQHNQEWNAHQVREQHRMAGRPCAGELIVNDDVLYHPYRAQNFSDLPVV